MEPASDDRTRRELSTGHTVSLPLELSCALGGAIVPARRARLESVLPDRLSPLAIAPRIGCVAFVGIQYHRVGGDDGLEPYDEFAVVVPAVREVPTETPLARLAGGEIGGYVHWLPVTTDASVALGRELWGYPKERADVTVTDGPRGLRAVVDGDRPADAIRLEVPRPRVAAGTARRNWRLWSYTTTDGELLRSPAEVGGEIALGSPLGTTLEVESDLATELGIWRRPLARLYGSRVRARLDEGEPVSDRNR